MAEDQRRPDPDPTTLTTAQLDRAIGNLERHVDDRLSAVETAAQRIHDDYTRVPTVLDRSIDQLRELLESYIKRSELVRDEKFGRVDIQFEEQNKRTEQLSLANSTAIAAALQAQKEAAQSQNESNAASITKSEAGFIKQIDGIAVLINSNNKATDDKIAGIILLLNNNSKATDDKIVALGTRLDRSEATLASVHLTRKDGRAGIETMTSIVALALAALAIIVTIIGFNLHHSP